MALLGGKKDEAPSKPLFKREDESVSTRAGDVHTLLGKGSEFDGKLTFEGQVRIEGKFNGQIFTKETLVVGDSARITAEIHAGTVVVMGTIEGNVKATQLVDLKRTGRIKGNVETTGLAIEQGGTFEGSCKMETTGGKTPPPPGGDGHGRK